MSEIDMNVFTTLKESTGSEFIAELIDTFLDDAPNLIQQMRAGIAARDAEAFRRAAHSMKSNCATFGAMDVSAMARELETLGREKNLEVGDRIDLLEAAFKQVSEQLSKLK